MCMLKKIGITFLPFLLIMLFFICVMCADESTGAGGGDSGGGSGGNGSKEMVETAMAELKPENNGGQKFWSYMGFGNRVEWCASFVSWCANECGYIESGIIPKSAWCNDFRDDAKRKNLWYDGQAHGGSYTPKRGDLILFQWDGNTTADLDHIGIVTDCDGTTVQTIEGNSGDVVSQRSYPAAFSSIIGYFSPDYPAGGDIGDLTGATNAERVYNALVRAGYTKESAAGIVGNLAGEGGTDANGDIVIDSTEAGYGEGIGICQWSFGRREAFIAFAGLKGEPWPGTSLGVQIQFMIQELETNQWLWTNIGMEYGSQYSISHAEFKTSTNVEFATTAFCANFERCHAADSHLSNRIAYAQKVLNSFK